MNKILAILAASCFLIGAAPGTRPRGFGGVSGSTTIIVIGDGGSVSSPAVFTGVAPIVVTGTGSDGGTISYSGNSTAASYTGTSPVVITGGGSDGGVISLSDFYDMTGPVPLNPQIFIVMDPSIGAINITPGDPDGGNAAPAVDIEYSTSADDFLPMRLASGGAQPALDISTGGTNGTGINVSVGSNSGSIGLKIQHGATGGVDINFANTTRSGKLTSSIAASSASSTIAALQLQPINVLDTDDLVFNVIQSDAGVLFQTKQGGKTCFGSNASTECISKLTGGGLIVGGKFTSTDNMETQGVMTVDSYANAIGGWHTAGSRFVDVTLPSLGAGFGTGAATAGLSTASFSLTIGSSPSNTGVLTFATSSGKWKCSCEAQLADAGFGPGGNDRFCRQAGYSTSTVTLYAEDLSGVSGNWTPGTVLLLSCFGG